MFLVLKYFSESTTVLLAIILSICINIKVTAGEQHQAFVVDKCNHSKSINNWKASLNATMPQYIVKNLPIVPLLWDLSSKNFSCSGPLSAVAFLDPQADTANCSAINCPSHPQVSMFFNNLNTSSVAQARATVIMPWNASSDLPSVKIQFNKSDPEGLGVREVLGGGCDLGITCHPDGSCNTATISTNQSISNLEPPNSMTCNEPDLDLIVTICPDSDA